MSALSIVEIGTEKVRAFGIFPSWGPFHHVLYVVVYKKYLEVKLVSLQLSIFAEVICRRFRGTFTFRSITWWNMNKYLLQLESLYFCSLWSFTRRCIRTSSFKKNNLSLVTKTDWPCLQSSNTFGFFTNAKIWQYWLITNFVFPFICNILLYLQHMKLVNMK